MEFYPWRIAVFVVLEFCPVSDFELGRRHENAPIKSSQPMGLKPGGWSGIICIECSARSLPMLPSSENPKGPRFSAGGFSLSQTSADSRSTASPCTDLHRSSSAISFCALIRLAMIRMALGSRPQSSAMSLMAWVLVFGCKSTVDSSHKISCGRYGIPERIMMPQSA